jgi:hypothetical protein
VISNSSFTGCTGSTCGSWSLYAGDKQSGSANFSGGLLNCSGCYGIVSQNVTLTPGKTYHATVIYNMTAGSKLRIMNSGTDYSNVVCTSGVLSGYGTYTCAFTATGNNISLGADSAVYSGYIQAFSVVTP